MAESDGNESTICAWCGGDIDPAESVEGSFQGEDGEEYREIFCSAECHDEYRDDLDDDSDLEFEADDEEYYR